MQVLYESAIVNHRSKPSASPSASLTCNYNINLHVLKTFPQWKTQDCFFLRCPVFLLQPSNVGCTGKSFCANVSLKVEVEAGKMVPVLIWELASLWWRGQRGDLHVPWPCLSLAGPPLEVLEVEVGPAQLEAVEEDTEVTITCQLQTHYAAFPFFSLLCPCSLSFCLPLGI